MLLDNEFMIFYKDSGVSVYQHGKETISVNWSFGSIEYNLVTGVYKVYGTGKDDPILSGVYSEVKLNGETIKTCALSRNENCLNVSPWKDGFGDGVKVTVKNSSRHFTVLQNYFVYPNLKFFLSDVVIEVEEESYTNYISVLKTDENISLPYSADLRFLFVPFDNDEFVRYDAKQIPCNAESYEVTAMFDNTSRSGVVTGSVTHDTWKTGIKISSAGKKTTGFNVFGGITSFETRDTEDSETNKEIQPHGMVGGKAVNSPKIFFGFFDDWRDGMEEYGRANSIIAPPLTWGHGVPFGWNSWSAVATKITYDIYVNSSDFVKNNLGSFCNGKNANYINFDAFWSNLSEEVRIKAALHVQNNAQNPGIYHTPFTCWHDTIEKTKENSPDGVPQYKWYDLILKDKDGKPLQYMHGKRWPLDPSHPGTLAYNEHMMKKFKSWGYRYLKLDFLSHGAMEGVHYDKNITTGIQAYNYGLKKLIEVLEDDIRGEKFFISLSIAPIFPSQYAHGRRISCDVFGEIRWSEYMLNSLNYGWWMHNTIYPLNDPDHIVVYTSFNRPKEKGPILENEGAARYISAAISGGFMIDSDDFSEPEAQERAVKILNNEEINALPASGRTFRPVEGNTGSESGELFIRDDTAIDGCFYLAAFNFSDAEKKAINVDINRIGLDSGKTYSVRELVSRKDIGKINGSWIIELDVAEPKLFKLEVFV